MTASHFKTIVYGGSAAFLAVAFLVFPKEAYEASIRGLSMWWEVVFPSLLPFFILSELLIGFGVVTFIGVLFEPVMRPLFRVPGSGGFVWAMGMASGFPAGARLTARLRKDRKLTRIQAERLASFTNASNPVFIFGAIAVGFFHNPQLGLLLAVCHYSGNLLTGLAMRFYGSDESDSGKDSRLSVRQAFRMMHKERIRDRRPLGKILGDAVHSAVSTLLMIGGFIILFSVLNQLLTVLHVSQLFAVVLTIILAFFQIPNELSPSLISGLFEITIGSQIASQTEGIPLFFKAVVVSFILGFNGFSVQAQVASILAETDIRFKPFFAARLLHGFCAAVLAALLFKPLYLSRVTEPVSGPDSGTAVNNIFVGIYDWLTVYGGLITLFTLVMYIFYRAVRSAGPSRL
ncbi:sporulation integral membrane protein YlbJ [Alteribacter natronophilus]|uniref:sporulation integral membrane protein YlbJ n=1 Tax=Alteribacter natronophilus TaxID=2583810 RepID=UPI00110E1181|nr:sporulation integral membrane protein YlbJ [Alteribacter natronophilus]TMW73106.1 sporulation integral membrane protein YlbJ [Alteribacter natronophilus]